MKIYLKRSTVLCCIMLISPLIATGQIKVSEQVEQQIDSIFAHYKGQPGCAIAVVKNGETLFQKGYGLANLSHEIPISTKTIFDATALAKQITAACIFILEKEGKLNLDDPIQKFIPEFPTYQEGRITIKNLLYQNSGLRSYLAILYTQNKYFGDRIDNENVLELVANQKNLNLKPGERNDLSNSNYVLLANVVEKASGKSMALYAKEKLLDPLNMVHTFFRDNPNKVIKNQARAYHQEGKEYHLHEFSNHAVIGDGGLQSSLEDLVVWTQNLSTGVVGGKELVSKLVMPGKLNSGVQTNYAGGVFLQNHYDIEGLPSARHSGEWAGFRSLHYRFLNSDVTFIILSNNASTNVWRLLDLLTPHFVAGEIAKAQESASSNNNPPPKEVNLSIAQKENFQGSYYNTINGNIRSIEVNNGTILYKRTPNAPGTPLVPKSETELFFQVAPHIQLSYGSKNFNDMILTINNRDPAPFQRYEEHVHSKEELMTFENSYYNEDCKVVYQILADENGLKIMIDGEELVSLTSMTRDMFRDEHFGYITFHRDSSGKIRSFSRTDNTFTNLIFNVL